MQYTYFSNMLIFVPFGISNFKFLTVKIIENLNRDCE